MEVSRRRDVFGLCAFVALSFGVAALGGLGAAKGFPDWYPALAKPGWTPPDWAFGPVWTLLFALIASAGWLGWRDGRSPTAVRLYLAQLALNLAWPWLFFAGHGLALAFAAATLLCLLALATAAAFWRTNRAAAVLFVPYVAWLGFAAVLNLAVWLMNRR